MAKKIKKVDLSNPREKRQKMGKNQAEFWRPFCVTQSGGSRYEQGRDIPAPVKLLMALRELGKITDDDLRDARIAVGL